MITSKGHVNPGDPHVAFVRLGLGLDDLVRHVWIARWRVPVGQTRPQRVLTYPACNIVFTPSEACLYGPDRLVQVRELAGESWVVGILLRPAAALLFAGVDPARLVGGREPLTASPHEEIVAAMSESHDSTDKIMDLLHSWLAPYAGAIDDSGRLVNDVCRLVEERSDLVHVAALAREIGMTTRTLDRLVKRHTGLNPKWLIECRRLQTAATTLFAAPDTDLAELAARLGYSDQAHLSRRYKAVLGESPDLTRRAGRSATVSR